MKKGFTLIELLVVIAIIAILASILFPVFNNAMEKARQTQCLSNTKQIALAFTMYEGDWNQCLPVISRDAVTAYGDGGDCTEGYDGHWRAPDQRFVDWAKIYSYRAQLNAYAKNGKIFFCPSDGYEAEENDCWEVACNITSYHYKLQFAGASFFGWGPNGAAKPYKATFFDRPAQIVVTYETFSNHDKKDQGMDSRYNVTFLDGHARSAVLREFAPHGDPHWMTGYVDGSGNYVQGPGNRTAKAYDCAN
ncbi:MAG: prepilin-type N-terminal cleavage/methylation domain-containing protein [Abditibacteriota bacterium]|nr:prepilin-type N-terminal cleavage/methylation domain-containing protein [Abditibacteriota bacterium]